MAFRSYLVADVRDFIAGSVFVLEDGRRIRAALQPPWLHDENRRALLVLEQGLAVGIPFPQRPDLFEPRLAAAPAQALEGALAAKALDEAGLRAYLLAQAGGWGGDPDGGRLFRRAYREAQAAIEAREIAGSAPNPLPRPAAGRSRSL